jgi:hypothetical protein
MKSRPMPKNDDAEKMRLIHRLCDESASNP